MTAKLEFINREISLENMLLAQCILRSQGLDPFLHYGTLLGAMREKDFIPHDDDVDFGLFGRDKNIFLQVIPELKEAGFEICYIRDDGYAYASSSDDDTRNFRMYKLKRKDQELDFFMAFEKKISMDKTLGYRRTGDDPMGIFLSSLDTVEFLGHQFACPHDPIGFLKNMYGNTWNVPIRDTTSRIGWLTRLKKLKNPLKIFFYAKRFVLEKIRKQRIKRSHGKEQQK